MSVDSHHCFSLVAVLIIAGCGARRDANWADTAPVMGVVYVDGQPAAGVAIQFASVDGMDEDQPTVTTAVTGEDGRFHASTYEHEDGAPRGEYKLTFTWGELNPISMQFEGDRLKGRYEDPDQSEFSVTVADQPVDVGRLDLSTK